MSERNLWLKLNHFFTDQQNQNHRTWMNLYYESPGFVKGWPRDGSIYCSIGEDKDMKASFKLSIDEVARIKNVLSLLIENHETALAKLYAESREKHKAKSEQKDTTSPPPPPQEENTNNSLGILDYKQGPLYQAIVHECNLQGGQDTDVLVTKLTAQGFAIDKIRNVLDLMRRDGIIAESGSNLILV